MVFSQILFFFHDVNSEVAPINNPNPINIHLLINLDECGTYGTFGTYGTTVKNLNQTSTCNKCK